MRLSEQARGLFPQARPVTGAVMALPSRSCRRAPWLCCSPPHAPRPSACAGGPAAPPAARRSLRPQPASPAARTTRQRRVSASHSQINAAPLSAEGMYTLLAAREEAGACACARPSQPVPESERAVRAVPCATLPAVRNIQIDVNVRTSSSARSFLVAKCALTIR